VSPAAPAAANTSTAQEEEDTQILQSIKALSMKLKDKSLQNKLAKTVQFN
jgi:hypothetical protein